MTAPRILLCFVMAVAALMTTVNAVSASNALRSYVERPDDSFSWKKVSRKNSAGFDLFQLELTSQTWRGKPWKHPMLVVKPEKIRNPDIAFILVAGSELPESHLYTLKTVAEQAGALAAVVGEVPNQPLFDDRVEDALIAYTFEQYLQTGDETWPLLFPMVKSAVRAGDAVVELARKEFDHPVTRLVFSGASKRGWTTWLTAAVDQRVAGIAPIVFDMLNMKAQTEWSRKVYGHQSEQIGDYTEAGLIKRIDEPRAVQLREWIDPFWHREHYTMPKLILLGTNDPYWTVDSLRHYWADLPGPKLIFQTPNAGHNIGGSKDLVATKAAFFEMVADKATLPALDWQVQAARTNAEIEIRSDSSFKAARLWMATSEDRDFRDDHWEAYPVKRGKHPGSAGVSVVVPGSGYRAFLMEAEFLSPRGQRYKLSTQAIVVPE